MNDFKGDEYYNVLASLYKYIQDNNLGIDMLPMVSEIKVPPKVFIDYIFAAGNDYKRFKLTCKESEFQDHIMKIMEKIPEGLPASSSVPVVAADYDFEPVVQHLKEKVESDSLTEKNVVLCYQLYKALAKEKPIQKLSPKKLASFLSSFSSNGKDRKDREDIYFDLLAMRLAYGNESPYMHGVDESVPPKETMVSRLVERIECFTSYGDLLLTFLDWQKPLLKAVLESMDKPHSDVISKSNIADVLKRYSELQSSLDIPPQDFIMRLNEWCSEGVEEQLTAESILDIQDHVIYKHAVQPECDCHLTRHLIKIMIKALNSLSVEKWEEDFQNTKSFRYKVACHLLDANKLVQVPDNAVSAYSDILKKIAKDEYRDSEIVRSIFYKKIDKGRLIPTAKDIRDIFMSIFNTPTAEQFILFSDLLLEWGALQEKSADVVRKILTPICNKDDNFFQFIVDNEQKFVPIMNKAGNDAAGFKDLVRRKMYSSHDKKLDHFASMIGVQNNKA